MTRKRTRSAQVVKIQDELGKQVGLAVQAELRAKNMDQKANNLLRQVEELTVRNRELESGSGIGSPGVERPSIVDPPIRTAPPNVRGKVKSVSERGTGLVVIDIGSDSGLSSGNVLIVYRGAEFLGELKLTTVEAKQAAGMFSPNKKTSRVQVGDQVITSFASQPQ